MKFFRKLDTNLVFTSSNIVLRETVSDISKRILDTIPPRESLAKILPLLADVPDSPKLRHWLSTSVVLLRSNYKALDPDPRFVFHFFADSLNSDRLYNLHALNALELIVEHNLSNGSDFEWSDKYILAPKGFHIWGLGSIEIPESLIGLTIKTSRNGLFIHAGNIFSIDLLRDHTGEIDLSSHPIKRDSIVSTLAGKITIPLSLSGFADAYHSNCPVVKGRKANQEWAETLVAAVELIYQLDQVVAQDCIRLAPAALALHRRSGAAYGSSSPQELMGLVYLPGVSDIFDVAECLLHEAMHQKLFRAEEGSPLFVGDNGDEEIYYSPWRADPRPLRMLFHGSYVFTGVAEFWNEISMLQPEFSENFASAKFHVYYRAKQALQALSVIKKHGNLSSLGEKLYIIVEESLSGLLANLDIRHDLASQADTLLEEHTAKYSIYVH